MRLGKLPAERVELSQHLLINETFAHRAIPVHVVAFTTEHGHDAACVPPTAVPNRAGCHMAPGRVAQRAIEQGGKYVAAHEIPDPLGQAKVALETGRQRPRLPVGVMQISITLVDEAQRNVRLDGQPTAAANDGVRKAPASHPTCFVRRDVRQEALCIGDRAVR